MKLTKSKLQQIIKEEITKIITEDLEDDLEQEIAEIIIAEADKEGYGVDDQFEEALPGNGPVAEMIDALEMFGLDPGNSETFVWLREAPTLEQFASDPVKYNFLFGGSAESAPESLQDFITNKSYIYEGEDNLKNSILTFGDKIKQFKTPLEEKKKKKKKDDKWIQKAVDPKHKGYCTPMTKKTCTPKRKAFAKIMKTTIRKKNLKKGKNPHGPG